MAAEQNRMLLYASVISLRWLLGSEVRRCLRFKPGIVRESFNHLNLTHCTGINVHRLVKICHHKLLIFNSIDTSLDGSSVKFNLQSFTSFALTTKPTTNDGRAFQSLMSLCEKCCSFTTRLVQFEIMSTCGRIWKVCLRFYVLFWVFVSYLSLFYDVVMLVIPVS